MNLATILTGSADRTEGRRRGKGRALQRQGGIAMMAWAAR